MKLCIVTPNIMKGDGQSRVNYEIVWEAIHRGYQITVLASQVAPELEHNNQVNWISIPSKGYQPNFCVMLPSLGAVAIGCASTALRLIW